MFEPNAALGVTGSDRGQACGDQKLVDSVSRPHRHTCGQGLSQAPAGSWHKSYQFARALTEAGIGGVHELPLGFVVAMAQLVACLQTPLNYAQLGRHPKYGHLFTSTEFAFGDYEGGRWAWVLADVQALAQPIPAKGALGLWEVGCSTGSKYVNYSPLKEGSLSLALQPDKRQPARPVAASET